MIEEALLRVEKILEGFSDDFGTMKLTGYDNLEMLKKILMELQELNENFALMMGKENA